MRPARISADDLKLGWLSPPEIRRLRLSTPDDEPLVTVDKVSADLPLWQRLLAPHRLGHVQLEKPEVSLFLDANGNSNFSRTFGNNRAYSASDLSEKLTLSCDLRDGCFHFRRAPDASPWTLESLNVTVELERPTSESATSCVVIKPGLLIDDLELTPEIGNDILKFIAPVLADASSVEGNFSLSIEEARLPLSDLSSAHIEGILKIHSVHVGANNLVKQILMGIGLPGSIQLIEENPVHFKMADGAVWHQGLRFEVGTLSVETSGYVGLDQSLDLVATVTLPDLGKRDSPLVDSLSQRQIEIPIHGTLSAPVASGRGLLDEGSELLAELMPNLFDPNATSEGIDLEAVLSELVQRRRERLAGDEPTDDDRLLPNLRDRIRQVLEPPADVSPSEQPTDSPPRRGILNRLRTRRREQRKD